MNFTPYESRVNESETFRKLGKVTDIAGNLITGYLPDASVGSVCVITASDGQRVCEAEVIGLRDGKVLMMPYGNVQGIGAGNAVELLGKSDFAFVGQELIGRVIDGRGRPIDNKGEIRCKNRVSLMPNVINPLDREKITDAFDIGVKAVNGFTTLARGQRVGLMAGSGVGKSVLMGMMARYAEADINVIALIGERGREVKEFIEDTLGEEGLKKSVIVCVTSDQSPLLRMRGAQLATTIAEYFSGRGSQVLFIMDSVTRFAMAHREVSLQAGEPPASKGYTSGLYPALSKLLERAGNFDSGGSITGIYTVLVEGGDMDEPVADTVRSIVDGHIVLSRRIANQGIYPAVDILQSLSRLMDKVISPAHKAAAKAVRSKLSLYRESEDLINVGAYKKGSNPEIDASIAVYQELIRFMNQELSESIDLNSCVAQLETIAIKNGGMR
ncbi:MAG: FliI/YscN family ATPase [Bdellovibrionaceae bacterium]|nr:FliI/YscN family ATPase [Pseudobdellovibrionaceae bacterium]